MGHFGTSLEEVRRFFRVEQLVQLVPAKVLVDCGVIIFSAKLQSNLLRFFCAHLQI